jgi:hypothetical protein
MLKLVHKSELCGDLYISSEGALTRFDAKNIADCVAVLGTQVTIYSKKRGYQFSVGRWYTGQVRISNENMDELLSPKEAASFLLDALDGEKVRVYFVLQLQAPSEADEEYDQSS